LTSDGSPQGDDPVRVLLHTHSVEYSANTGYSNFCPLSLAGGKGEFEILPEQPRFPLMKRHKG
jgi:hypothetical protein